MAAKITEDVKQQVIALYQQKLAQMLEQSQQVTGWTPAMVRGVVKEFVALQLKISKNSVRMILIDAGLLPLSKNAQQLSKNLFLVGMSPAVIARRFHISEAKVHEILLNAGCQPPPLTP